MGEQHPLKYQMWIAVAGVRSLTPKCTIYARHQTCITVTGVRSLTTRCTVSVRYHVCITVTGVRSLTTKCATSLGYQVWGVWLQGVRHHWGIRCEEFDCKVCDITGVSGVHHCDRCEEFDHKVYGIIEVSGGHHCDSLWGVWPQGVRHQWGYQVWITVTGVKSLTTTSTIYARHQACITVTGVKSLTTRCTVSVR